MARRHTPNLAPNGRYMVIIGGRSFWCGKDHAAAVKLTNALDLLWDSEVATSDGKKCWSNKSIAEAYIRVGMTPPASVNMQQPVMAQAVIIQTPVPLTLGPRFRPAFQPREISFHDALGIYVEMRLAKRTIRRAGEDSEQIIGSLKHHLADMPLQDIDAAVHRILTDKIINLPPNRTTGKPISIVTARWWLRELGAAFEWFSHLDSRIGWIPPYPQWREKFSIIDEEAKALAKNVGDENFGKVKPIFNLDQPAILHKCTTPLDRLYLLGGVCLGWTAIEFATLKRSQIQTDQDGETYIVNKERSKTGVEMTFWVCPELAELLKQFVAATIYDYSPSGKLKLSILTGGYDNLRRNWTDLVRRNVEACLNTFIAALIKVAEQEKADRIKAEQQKRYWEEQDRIRKEEARRAAEEKARRDDLDAKASAWRKSQRLREYISAMEDAAARKFGQIDPESKLEKWLAWAKLREEKINPIGTALDQLTQERTGVEDQFDVDDDDD
jgi:hypothetical protein